MMVTVSIKEIAVVVGRLYLTENALGRVSFPKDLNNVGLSILIHCKEGTL